MKCCHQTALSLLSLLSASVSFCLSPDDTLVSLWVFFKQNKHVKRKGDFKDIILNINVCDVGSWFWFLTIYQSCKITFFMCKLLNNNYWPLFSSMVPKLGGRGNWAFVGYTIFELFTVEFWSNSFECVDVGWLYKSPIYTRGRCRDSLGTTAQGDTGDHLFLPSQAELSTDLSQPTYWAPLLQPLPHAASWNRILHLKHFK